MYVVNRSDQQTTKLQSYSLGKLVLKIPQSWLYSYMKRVTVRAFRGMKKFVKFTLIWISQNLAIPFWIVGHIHLSVNIYKDIHELLASLSMNIIVLIGFLIDFKTNGKK